MALGLEAKVFAGDTKFCMLLNSLFYPGYRTRLKQGMHSHITLAPGGLKSMYCTPKLLPVPRGQALLVIAIFCQLLMHVVLCSRAIYALQPTLG